MSADYTQPQPPLPAQRRGCRRGCIIGCILAIVFCFALGVAAWAGIFAVIRYLESQPPEAMPCTIMKVWLDLAERALENPQGSPQDTAEARRTLEEVRR